MFLGRENIFDRTKQLTKTVLVKPELWQASGFVEIKNNFHILFMFHVAQLIKCLARLNSERSVNMGSVRTTQLKSYTQQLSFKVILIACRWRLSLFYSWMPLLTWKFSKVETEKKVFSLQRVCFISWCCWIVQLKTRFSLAPNSIQADRFDMIVTWFVCVHNRRNFDEFEEENCVCHCEVKRVASPL